MRVDSNIKFAFTPRFSCLSVNVLFESLYLHKQFLILIHIKLAKTVSVKRDSHKIILKNLTFKQKTINPRTLLILNDIILLLIRKGGGSIRADFGSIQILSKLYENLFLEIYYIQFK